MFADSVTDKRNTVHLPNDRYDMFQKVILFFMDL